jgi:hypothetical protein
MGWVKVFRKSVLLGLALALLVIGSFYLQKRERGPSEKTDGFGSVRSSHKRDSRVESAALVHPQNTDLALKTRSTNASAIQNVDLISLSRQEHLKCTEQLRELERKLHGGSTADRSALALIEEFSAIPAFPESSSLALNRIQLGQASVNRIRDLGDCDPVGRSRLFKELVSKVAHRSRQDESPKGAIHSLLEILRADCTVDTTLLVQLSKADALLALARSGLIPGARPVEDEILALRGDYQSESATISPQMDSFKTAQIEVDLSQRIRAKLCSIIERLMRE